MEFPVDKHRRPRGLNLPGEKRRRAIAAREAYKAETDPSKRAAKRLVALAIDFNAGLPVLSQTNPELAQKVQADQHEVAETRRRAQSNPDILDMRLD